jgi:hypothetical protein
MVNRGGSFGRNPIAGRRCESVVELWRSACFMDRRGSSEEISIVLWFASACRAAWPRVVGMLRNQEQSATADPSVYV